jgi:hypothetical protein
MQETDERPPERIESILSVVANDPSLAATAVAKTV